MRLCKDLDGSRQTHKVYCIVSFGPWTMKSQGCVGFIGKLVVELLCDASNNLNLSSLPICNSTNELLLRHANMRALRQHQTKVFKYGNANVVVLNAFSIKLPSICGSTKDQSRLCAKCCDYKGKSRAKCVSPLVPITKLAY